jgi:hypothetical protein
MKVTVLFHLLFFVFMISPTISSTTEVFYLHFHFLTAFLFQMVLSLPKGKITKFSQSNKDVKNDNFAPDNEVWHPSLIKKKLSTDQFLIFDLRGKIKTKIRYNKLQKTDDYDKKLSEESRKENGGGRAYLRGSSFAQSKTKAKSKLMEEIPIELGCVCTFEKADEIEVLELEDMLNSLEEEDDVLIGDFETDTNINTVNTGGDNTDIIESELASIENLLLSLLATPGGQNNEMSTSDINYNGLQYNVPIPQNPPSNLYPPPLSQQSSSIPFPLHFSPNNNNPGVPNNPNQNPNSYNNNYNGNYNPNYNQWNMQNGAQNGFFYPSYAQAGGQMNSMNMQYGGPPVYVNPYYPYA